ncbi:MAG: hypothetical protein JJ916_00205 [Phycisphaerales bacterium]|nr:hypothetical protein [Phycisphaerales bacterium]
MTPLHRTILFALSVGLFAPGIAAQPAEEPGGAATLPSLDELLGLEEQADGTDPNEAALREVLSPREAGEALGQAVKLMDQVAQRIGTDADVSIATQRLQEDILRKLDQVIESAQNNQLGSGGGSSSSQSSSSENQQQPDQQQQQGQGDQQQNAPGNEAGQEAMPGGSSAASPGDALAPDGVSWGALPQRIRDALSQGFSDRYSELYRTLTEEYYRALAEDENP